MSTAPEAGYIPEWDMADRMRKTLRDNDVSVQEIAEYLGVSRNTVSTWINGRITPDLTTQRLWAMRFGVPLVWLQSGAVPAGGDDGRVIGMRKPQYDSSVRVVPFRREAA